MGIFKGHFHVVAEVGPALTATGSTTASPATHHLTKDVFKYIREPASSTATS